MTELELKFQIPPSALEALRADLAAGPGAAPDPQRLQATYVDTEDTLLGRHRIAWRLRREGERWVQTLKAAVPHSIDRLEDNVDRGPVDAAGSVPALDPDAHRDTPAGRLLRDVLEAHPQARLGPRYATDVTRLRRLAAHRGAMIEVAFDDGEIVAGSRRARVCEIEFERVSGDASALFDLAARWQAAHGLWLDVTSKAERGERLARGDAFGEAVRATPPRLDRRMPADEVLRRVLAACLAQVLPGVSALAHGCRDDEHLHQTRVGLRRLRTALRELGRDAPQVDPGWEAPLAAAFHALGHVRDETVLPALFAPQLAAAGAPLTTWGAADGVARGSPGGRDVGDVDEVRGASGSSGSSGSSDSRDSSDKLRAIVLEPALQGALLALLAAAEGADGGARDGDAAPSSKDARRALARRLSALHADVARGVRGFEAAPREEQHRVRKRLKRLRYLAEFAGPLHGRRAVERYLVSLEPAQEALGRLNDEAVALERFRVAATRDPRALFAVGWFEARHGATARAAGRALRKVARAERFWR